MEQMIVMGMSIKKFLSLSGSTPIKTRLFYEIEPVFENNDTNKIISAKLNNSKSYIDINL